MGAEDGWIAVGSGSRGRPRAPASKERAHAAAVAALIVGIVLITAVDQLPRGSKYNGVVGGGWAAAATTPLLAHWRQPTAPEKMAEMKSPHYVRASMLAGGAGAGGGRGGENSTVPPGKVAPVVINDKIDVQPSPEGPLAHVRFNPPAGVDYRVKVDVYFETLSAACKVFTEWVLVGAVGSEGMLDIIDLRMIPWGHAKLLKQEDGKPTVVVGEGNITRFEGAPPKFLCEHGAPECEGNAWVGCVQKMYPDVRQWFRVVSCIQSHSCADGEAPTVDSVAHTGSSSPVACRGLPVDVAPKCMRDFGGGMDVDAVRACAHAPQGTKLMLDNMELTEALAPPAGPPTYFPWVVMDGVALNYTSALLLGKSVCDRYVQKVQPYFNGSVPQPLGCFFFPDEPPNFPQPQQGDYFGISLLWICGGIVFVLGVAILAYWKYSTTVGAQKGYEEIDPWGEAARG